MFKYTNRIAITEEYFPRPDEAELYVLVTNYLRKPELYALPNSQRQLMTLILRKLLASSTYAISGTLEKLGNKLQDIVDGQEAEEEEIEFKENLAEDYETYGELEEEWDEESEEKIWYAPHEIEGMKEEIAEIRKMESLAKSIDENSKGEKLITALEKGFEKVGRNLVLLRKLSYLQKVGELRIILKKFLMRMDMEGRSFSLTDQIQIHDQKRSIRNG